MSTVVPLLLVGLAATLIVVGVCAAMARADKRFIAAYGAERGWTLKQVRWMPVYVFRATRSYYRALVITGEEEKTVWFRSTFRTDPVETQNPFQRPNIPVGSPAALIFSLVLGIVVAAGAGAGGWHRSRVEETLLSQPTWPEVKGIVVDSGLSLRVGRRSKQGFSQQITYQYSVDGTDYTNDRVSSGEPVVIWSSLKEARKNLPPPGAPIAVRFNPARPEQSVLRVYTGTPGEGRMILLSLWVLTAIGVAIAVISGITYARQRSGRSASGCEVKDFPCVRSPRDA